MCTPLRLFKIIHNATVLQWVAFPPDWAHCRTRGLVSDQRGTEFDTCLELHSRETCVLSLRTNIRGPFNCEPETFVRLLAQACTVTQAAFALPNGHDSIAIQACALHAPIESSLGELAVDVFRRFRRVLNSHGVQTLMSMSMAPCNGHDVQPWRERLSN